MQLKTQDNGVPQAAERDILRPPPAYSSDALKYESENIISCIQTRWAAAELIKWTQFDESSKKKSSDGEKENEEDGDESSVSEK